MQEVKIIPEEVKPIAVFCFYSGIWNGLWTAYHDPEERKRFEEWKKERAAAQTSAPEEKEEATAGETAVAGWGAIMGQQNCTPIITETNGKKQ